MYGLELNWALASEPALEKECRERLDRYRDDMWQSERGEMETEKESSGETTRKESQIK